MANAQASAGPSSPQIKAAEELELPEDEFEDVPTTPPPASPTKSPSSASKVRAAAAKWESGAAATPTSKADRPRLSPSTSFRSINPASSSTSARHLSPEKLPLASSATSPSSHRLQISPTTPEHVPVETFSEVPLAASPKDLKTPVPPAEAKSYSLSPGPPPSDLILPEPVVTPPADDAPTPQRSFFSSALGLGFPKADATPKLETRSSSDGGQGGWRGAVSNLLTRSTSSTSAAPSSTSSAGPSRQSSTSFLLQRVESSTASRDRRASREAGGSDKLREGFERVKGEMETAAREMRRERQMRDPGRVSDVPVDWTFWGAVVQDYEEVARTRPKELSIAIQQGVPPVIRGAIWQLMSASKSPPLEEAYKALLKMTSPHEKAIVKDLNRTFPQHKHFQEGGGVGQESLFMVVKAYSLYDQEVGYTQGLAFIVAALLLNMPDEEAFCVLVRLMDSYNLRSHYLADMPGLQLRLFQFDRLMEEILPLLHTSFLRKGIKSSMFASQWFMTLFSYRFPLALVYRVLDIVFAEGVEAIFRFSLALLKKSEDTLVDMEFEEILNFLQTDLFEMYRVGDSEGEEEWKANEFVRDAYEIRITPFMLDSYEAEHEELCRAQNRHAQELDQLRNANRNLSGQVKQLEASLSTMNQEHVELVRQLVMCKIEKEETENELVRYKMI
ncbi:GTPase-activating protein [Saitozyma podzolica]|uniref:GTPase-activating protein n=1 Tax=Saitozyma podzolica TaxID=1890683 RepID=A0A427XRL9_9TREE|nr:GTPase-activating protein [Saitozyma podzolica]